MNLYSDNRIASPTPNPPPPPPSTTEHGETQPPRPSGAPRRSQHELES